MQIGQKCMSDKVISFSAVVLSQGRIYFVNENMIVILLQ